MGFTFINISEPDGQRGRSYWGIGLVVVLVLLIAAFLHWGGYLVEASDALPDHVEAAVVLQGPMVSEKARVAAAMTLLQRGAADRVALSIPKQSPWDEEVATVAQVYLQKTYGPELSGKVDFCETGTYESSVEQEARDVSECIQVHHWKTIVIITSNYASRRVGLVWKPALFKRDQSIQVAVNGIADPEYQAHGWWRQSLYAKVWVTEVSRLVRSVS